MVPTCVHISRCHASGSKFEAMLAGTLHVMHVSVKSAVRTKSKVQLSVFMIVRLERERTCECKYPQCLFGVCACASACGACSVADAYGCSMCVCMSAQRCECELLFDVERLQ